MRTSSLAWPGYQAMRSRPRLFFEKGYAIDALGKRTTIASYADIIDLSNHYDIYIHDLQSFPYLRDAIEHDASDILIDSHQRMRSISIHHGRRRGKIVTRRAWVDNAITDPVQFLRFLYDVEEYTGVQCPLSPSGLGMTLWARFWHKNKHTAVYEPNMHLRTILEKNVIGGRVDHFSRRTYDTLIELDIKNAYLHFIKNLPGGTARPLTVWEPSEMATYYRRCILRILEPLDLGVFPYKQSEILGRTQYPTQPGTYEMYLWKEEIEECRKQGIHVEEREGYGYEIWDKRSAPFVAEMERLRNDAPSDIMRSVIKRSIVGMIGRHGISQFSYALIDYADVQDDDIPFTIDGRFYDLALRKKRRESGQGVLYHWFSYILAMCRVALYQRMRQELDDGNNIVASNYDAIYCEYPTQRIIGNETGMWRQTVLTNATIPVPRWLISDQKTVTPGISL